MKRLLAVFNARNREFFRDRSTLTWNLLFPFLLLAGFYLVFGQSQPIFKVGVLSDQDAYLSRPVFMSLNHIQFIPYDDSSVAIDRLRRHQIDLLMDIDETRYWVNDESSQGALVEELLIAKDPDFQRTVVTGQAIRYIDWVLPGIIGMNIMFSSLFGVGYAIVRYRKNGVLKRLHATPLTALEFIGAHLLSRILMVVFIVLVMLIGARYLFATLMLGSYPLLLLTLLLGSLSMVSLGLLVAARLRSEEFASGLLNMTTWPMMGLSEVWFPLEGAPHIVHQISQFLPLTHLVQAMREIMVDGAGLMAVSDHLLILALMSAVFLVIGALTFSWASDGR
ncbi:ABC transporter permease [Reinekea blandensis]|uniref:Putative ABC transporter, permease protein n=1 Tax=Reinekea blandensis MED297 TaxID=314283 RepID=A4BGB3_9GAMM|nr:ABC transporter permease [Reinekea blandensis]EAR08908.1 putative ABC transporter, permease protein [Reinekea sp. MED297] [Reinekea blandensis MED297]